MEWYERHPHGPDGRYFVVRGRLWRLSDPPLEPSRRAELVSQLMHARRSLKEPGPEPGAMRAARLRVDEIKRALGERGPVWWTDGDQDRNRKMLGSTPYAEWFDGVRPHQGTLS